MIGYVRNTYRGIQLITVLFVPARRDGRYTLARLPPTPRFGDAHDDIKHYLYNTVDVEIYHGRVFLRRIA